MKRVYTVTLYKGYNYGSALQCFALQQVIRSFGIQPYVINVYFGGLNWTLKRILNNIRVYFSFIKYPERRSSLYGLKENANVAVDGMPEETKNKIDKFITKRINEISVKYNELKKIASNDNCVACISGSDQVWGTSVKYLNPVHFLTFSPVEKRFSYAASFGGNTIPPWFKKDVKKYLSKYNQISVREITAVDLLNKLGFDRVTMLVDPVFLISDSDWAKIEKKPDIDSDDFSFMYFLNEPSSIAVNHSKHIESTNLSKKVYYAPNSNTSNIMDNVQDVCLSPEEFIWMIHHCNRVYTDSFHGVAFSIIFRKDFYVYQRAYVGVADQHSRVLSALSLFGLEKQFIQDDNYRSFPNYERTESVLSQERNRGLEYLRGILNC